MVLIILLFYHLLSIVYGAQNEQFCAENPNVLYCDQGKYEDLKGDCPADVSRISTSMETYKNIIGTFNDLRLEMAQGKTSFKSPTGDYTFPAAGDMIQLEWHPDLARVSSMWARTCPESNYPPMEQRHIPEAEKVGMTMFRSYNSDPINREEFWKNAVEQWKNSDLKDLLPYAKSMSLHPSSVNPIIYGKARFVGCGQINFIEDTKGKDGIDKLNHAFIVCAFTNADLDNDPIQFGTPPCTCPDKTICAEKERKYVGILCEYSRGYVNMSRGILVAFVVFISYLIGSN